MNNNGVLLTRLNSLSINSTDETNNEPQETSVLQERSDAIRVQVPIRSHEQQVRGRIEQEMLSVGYFSSHKSVLRRLGFTLGPVVGEGSYCRVRAAVHLSDSQRPLAVKIISRSLASVDFVHRFLPRELDILSWVQHPHVIRVHRIFDFRDYVYIFMDLARTDLLEQIRTNGALPERLARHYFRQLLSAISYLHRMDVAHRDLKCENVLLFADNVIKLADFGFARYCRELRDSHVPEVEAAGIFVEKCYSSTESLPVLKLSSLSFNRCTVHEKRLCPTISRYFIQADSTNTGQRTLSSTYCGSAAYAAPEILRGAPYNPKMSDVWSMGVILFTMVLGNLPFDDSNMGQMLQCQQKRMLRFSTQMAENISPQCQNLIRRMLEPDVCMRALLSQIETHGWAESETG